MNDIDLYHQKKKAQLDMWRADLEKLKAKASKASAEVQLEMNKHIRSLDKMINDNSTMLTEFAKESTEAWDSFTVGIETAWDALKSAINDTKKKF